jgi:hypothetical protein
MASQFKLGRVSCMLCMTAFLRAAPGATLAYTSGEKETDQRLIELARCRCTLDSVYYTQIAAMSNGQRIERRTHLTPRQD